MFQKLFLSKQYLLAQTRRVRLTQCSPMEKWVDQYYTRTGGMKGFSHTRYMGAPFFTERRCACRNYSQCAAENSPTPNMSSSSGEGDLTIVEVPENRFDEAIHHLKWNFFADEPLNNAVGLCAKGESQYELERHCLLTLKQGYSRMLLDKKGTIAGMILNGILKKGEREEAEKRLAELNDEKFKTIFRLLYKVNEKIDLFTKYGIEELFECRILSVDENYRGKGLANILLADSVKTAKNAGFKVCKTDATSVFSQKVCQKQGFHVEAEISYAELDESIRPAPPHQSLKLMVKLLD